jgi:hypothetical protein
MGMGGGATGAPRECARIRERSPGTLGGAEHAWELALQQTAATRKTKKVRTLFMQRFVRRGEPLRSPTAERIREKGVRILFRV